MEDVTPKLLETIQLDFQNRFNKSNNIKGLYEKIRNGTATYEDANKFAIETGRLLSLSLQSNISEAALPDGKMYYNIANRILTNTLTNNHKLITDVTSQVQTSLNKTAGIGIKAIVPEVNKSRISGLVNKVSSAAEFSTVAWLFEESIVNFSQSIVDDSIRENAEFHYKSGLHPKIVRKEVGNCCDWCKEVVGMYEYPDVPEDVYKRHRYCRCIVTYEAGKYATDVHTKGGYLTSDKVARIANSRAYQERLGIETQRQKAKRKRQAIALRKMGKANDSPKQITQNSTIVKKNLTEELKKLNAEDIEILKKYTGNLAFSLNREISQGLGVTKYRKQMERLDNALKKGIVTDDIVVWRQTIPEFLNIFPKGYTPTPDDMLKLKGTLITNDTFTSTSLEPFDYKLRNVKISIKVPKGYEGGLYIKNIPNNAFSYQEEMLFKRGFKYIVDDVKLVDGIYYMEARAING